MIFQHRHSSTDVRYRPDVNCLAISHVAIADTGVELHVRNHMKILLINERIRGRIVLLNGETDHARKSIRS